MIIKTMNFQLFILLILQMVITGLSVKGIPLNKWNTAGDIFRKHLSHDTPKP